MEQYNIPFYQKSSLKWQWNLLFLFNSLLITSMSVIFFMIVMKDDFILGLFFGIFMLILGLYFGYMYIAAGILKRFYIEMTTEYIKVSLPFKSKTVYWKEIYEARIYKFNNNTMCAILLEKDRNKKRKRTFSNNFNSLYGVPPYSFQISLALFKDIDADKLLFTIGEQLNNADKNDEINIEALVESYEEYHDSLIKAVIVSVLLCIAISITYGFAIYKLEKNYVAIPILGCFLIISGFNKYYLEKSFNIIIRLLVGLICLIQVPIAIVEEILMVGKFNITANNILNVIYEYFKYLFHNPMKQIIIIIVSIICFAIGAFRGRIKKEKVDFNVYD